MPKRWLPFVLIALIALQSVAALAGGHGFCQDDIASNSLVATPAAQAVDHVAIANTSTTNADSTAIDDCQDSRQDQDDCHNCGHCHGHFSSAMLTTSFGFIAINAPNPLPAYLARAPQQFNGRFLRPPIA